MARIRNLKPEFWTDGNIVQLTFAARLFYQGTWNFALCDRGHLPDDPMELKLKILPADDVDPVALVEELVKFGRLVRATTPDGRKYLRIARLADHNKVDPRWSPRCPYCTAEAGSSGEPHEASPKLPDTHGSDAGPPRNSAQEGKGREGKVGGREGRAPAPDDGRNRESPVTAVPPSKCPRHLHNPDPPPCGKCADARRAYEVWQKGRRDQHPSTRSVAEALAAARGEP